MSNDSQFLYFDRITRQALGILTQTSVTLGRKIVLVDFMVIEDPLDFNILLQRDYFYVMQDVIVSNENVKEPTILAHELNNSQELPAAILFQGDQLNPMQQPVVSLQGHACPFIDYQVKIVFQDLHGPFDSLLQIINEGRFCNIYELWVSFSNTV